MNTFALRFFGGLTMRTLLAAALIVPCMSLMGSTQASDDDPTGTWTWTTPKGVGTLKLTIGKAE